jgi:hypothetical protein
MAFEAPAGLREPEARAPERGSRVRRHGNETGLGKR